MFGGTGKYYLICPVDKRIGWQFVAGGNGTDENPSRWKCIWKSFIFPPSFYFLGRTILRFSSSIWRNSHGLNLTSLIVSFNLSLMKIAFCSLPCYNYVIQLRKKEMINMVSKIINRLNSINSFSKYSFHHHTLNSNVLLYVQTLIWYISGIDLFLFIFNYDVR